MSRKKSQVNKNVDKQIKEIEDIKKKYPDLVLFSTEKGKEEGQYNLFFKPRRQSSVPPEIRLKMRERASVMYRDTLTRQSLDLIQPDVVNQSPVKIYERVKGYYRSKDVFGSYIDTIVNFTISAFENDCQDLRIKEFYDNWCQDVKIKRVLRWMLHEFFTTGFVRTYKVLGPYEPGINWLRRMPDPPKPKKKLREVAGKRHKWSTGWVPIAYTVLNPTMIELRGTPLFNQTRVVFKPTDDMKELISREKIKGGLTLGEKLILDSIPPEIKAGIEKGEEIELDPMYIGEMDYRKQPYEMYPIPKAARCLESLEQKEDFKQAEYSTLDGITSEILVITVGDKDNPVTKEELEDVADLFDTAQKSFSVVWNHTLKIERVPIENIDEIFGKAKFEQVEMDISGSFGLARALVDGTVQGETSKDAMTLAIKGVIAEVQYAREQIEDWL